jgi:ATP-binding protein involved in chromosome partitioning
MSDPHISPEMAAARQGPRVQRERPEGLAAVRNIVAVGSGKGGVGKSTITTNLAVALAALGARVAVLDADIYGPSQPGLLGAKKTRAEGDGEQLVPIERHGIRFISMGVVMADDAPVVWRAPMAIKALYQFLAYVKWGDLDYLLIDMPPGTGDVQLSLAQQAPLTGSVVVTTPQDVALGVARKGLKMFQQVKVPLVGVVENMSGFVCTNCGTKHDIFKKDGGQTLAREAGAAFLGAIPLEADVVEGSDAGDPVVLRRPAGAASKAFFALARAFEKEIARLNALTPADEPLRVDTTAAGELAIEWIDGHKSAHSPWPLRTVCPCAACVDEDTGRRVLDPSRVPLDVKVTGVTPVGRYGVGLAFSDGHNTGIYTYDKLRKTCECADCLAKRGAVRSFPV